MIRKAKESDINEILKVLSHYNFNVLNPTDNSPIDNDAEELLTLYNQVSEIDLNNAFVAVHNGKIVGFSHYKHYKEGVAKTTLVTVLPKFRGHLQLARMKEAYGKGYKKLITYCEGPAAIEWYIHHFHYKILGTESVQHRLHFFTLKDRVIWGVHYGFNESSLKVMVCDLEDFFTSRGGS